MATILKVRDLVTRFYTIDGVVHAVNGVSFDLEEGETLAIVGESGSGKTVTVLSIVGLIPRPPGRVEGGKVIFFDDGRELDLLQLSEAELRRIRGRRIGFVFQDPMSSLNPVLPVGLQIAESLMEHLGMGAAEARQRAVELLDRVGIPDPQKRYSNYPHQFSGGMRQRAMIAIAIACRPRILIADEPTTALDVTVQAQIVELVQELRSELGMAVIWITHDLGVVAGIADRVQVMYGGLVMERAPVDDLYDDPRHPYTVGLLGALPRLDRAGSGRLANIEGTPPDLLEPIRCCPFAPRCVHAADRCWQEVPSLREVAPRHEVACFDQST